MSEPQRHASDEVLKLITSKYVAALRAMKFAVPEQGSIAISMHAGKATARVMMYQACRRNFHVNTEQRQAHDDLIQGMTDGYVADLRLSSYFVPHEGTISIEILDPVTIGDVTMGYRARKVTAHA